MHVTCVQLRDFRTYARAEAHLAPGLTVVHGPNGAGKTNLIEALYFGCTGRSIRTNNEREVLRFGSKATRVVVSTAHNNTTHQLSVGYGVLPDHPRPVKRMLIDGVAVDRMIDTDARPLLSVFLPDRLELVKGSPSLRRAHTDQLIAALWPSRRSARRAYSHSLLQRNALLSGIRTGGSSSSTLASWDMELARYAVELQGHRTETIGLLMEPFRKRASELGLVGDCSVLYKPRSTASDPEDFARELAKRLESDLRRGFSTHGPHRDDVALLRDGRDLRSYGSQGEQRLALLALLLAERDVLGELRGRLPLMLLDDVMSELDASRRERLVEALSDGGQSIITTTDPDQVPWSDSESVERLAVSPGVITQQRTRCSDPPSMVAM